MYITYIETSKDKSMNWNIISKKSSSEAWKIIEELEWIEIFIIERNMRHLNQAQSTLCLIRPLKRLLRTDSLTPFGEKVLT